MFARKIGIGLVVAAAACAGKTPSGGTGPVLEERLSFGFTRPTGEKAAIVSSGRLSADLTEALHSPVTAHVFATPRELATALGSGVIDAAWMSPGAYVQAARLAEIEPVLKLSRGGFGRYRSVFFTKAGKGIASLPDAQGKTLALVQGASMSGHLFPLAYLKRKGIDPHLFFAKLIEGKDHEEVCRLVFDGKADVGVTLSDYRAPDEMTPDGCVQAGMDVDAFEVFEAVGPIPNDVIAVRATLSAGMRDKLKDALLQMHRTENGKAEMKTIFHADGFVPAADTDFAAVRELENFMSE